MSEEQFVTRFEGEQAKAITASLEKGQAHRWIVNDDGSLGLFAED